jgi:hypothetical protein
LRLGGGERLEQALAHLVGDARTVVLDQDQRVFAGELGADRHAGVSTLAHRVVRVLQQVHEHLHHAIGIGGHAQIVYPLPDRHARSRAHARKHQRPRAFDDERDRHLALDLAAHEIAAREQALGDTAEPQGLVVHQRRGLVDVGAQLVERRPSAHLLELRGLA